MAVEVDVSVELCRLGEALLAQLDEILDVHTDATRTAVVSYGAVAPVDVQAPAAALWRTAIRAMCVEQREPDEEDLDRYAHTADVRAAQGVPREDFLVAAARAADNVWCEVERFARRLGTSAEALLALRVRNERWHNEVMRHLLQAPAPEAGEHHARFVAELVAGHARAAQVTAWTRWFGGDACRVVLARGPLAWSGSLLGQLPTPHLGLWAPVQGQVVGVVRHLPPPAAGALLAAGPPLPLEDARRSYRVARRILRAAEATGRTGVITLDDVGLLPAVMDDADVSQHLLERYVLRVEAAGPGATPLLDTVRAYLDARLRVDEAAHALFVHPNTVRYRLRRYEELTGSDLQEVDTVCEVRWALLAREIRLLPRVPAQNS